MKGSVPLLFLVLLVLAAAIAIACGSSRTLQSIAVNPASADANGEPVQFIATGYYNNPPSPITPQPATWGACYQNSPTNDVSVSSNGLAQCSSGAVGTYAIFAYDLVGKVCPQYAGPCGGSGCSVTGYAQLTCP